MDPNATLHHLIEAATGGFQEELLHHAQALHEWLGKEGFPPDDPMAVLRDQNTHLRVQVEDLQKELRHANTDLVDAMKELMHERDLRQDLMGQLTGMAADMVKATNYIRLRRGAEPLPLPETEDQT